MNKYRVWFAWIPNGRDLSDPGQYYQEAEFDTLEESQDFCRKKSHIKVTEHLFKDMIKPDCYLNIIKPFGKSS